MIFDFHQVLLENLTKLIGDQAERYHKCKTPFEMLKLEMNTTFFFLNNNTFFYIPGSTKYSGKSRLANSKLLLLRITHTRTVSTHPIRSVLLSAHRRLHRNLSIEILKVTINAKMSF